jgi:hypothetical protein
MHYAGVGVSSKYESPQAVLEANEKYPFTISGDAFRMTDSII